MSRLKDLMIDVQADIETVMSKKPHLTRDEVITTVSAIVIVTGKQYNST